MASLHPLLELDEVLEEIPVPHAELLSPLAELLPEFRRLERDAAAMDETVSRSEFVRRDPGKVFEVDVAYVVPFGGISRNLDWEVPHEE